MSRLRVILKTRGIQITEKEPGVAPNVPSTPECVE